MEEQKRKIRFNIMAIILIVVFCAAISPKVLQNDTFYTIKIGEYLLENGMTMQDPFSWHEGLIYTFPHWAYDIMIFLIYNLGGQLGIYISTIVLSSILGITLYLTCAKMNKNRVLAFVLTIGSMFVLKNYIAARAQLFTFIIYVLTVYFIEELLETKKLRYAIGLVIFPIIIANFHAATFYFYFILFMPYIGEAFIALFRNIEPWFRERKIKKLNKKMNKDKDEERIKKYKDEILNAEVAKEKAKIASEKRKKNPYKIVIRENNNIKYLIVVLIICIFTGFLTPQTTFEPYTHFIKLMKGDSTQNISEHLPLTLVDKPDLIIIFTLFIIILMFTDVKIRLSDLFMLGGLMFLTFKSRRQETMFILLCMPILARLICSFVNKYDPKGTEQLEKLMTKIPGMIITIALVAIMSLPFYKEKQSQEYIESKDYPVAAVDWMLENLDINKIKLFNEYNYGSYLIFRGIPVFIDSRCDLYLPEFNKDTDVFHDALNITRLDEKNIEKKLHKYGVTHLMVYNNSKINKYLKAKENIYTNLYKDKYFCVYEMKKGI